MCCFQPTLTSLTSPRRRRIEPSPSSDPSLTFLHHLCIDVTPLSPLPLPSYLAELNATSLESFGKHLNLLQPPYQKQIGRDVYALCYVEGPDGVVVELMRREGDMLPGAGIL